MPDFTIIFKKLAEPEAQEILNEISNEDYEEIRTLSEIASQAQQPAYKLYTSA